jgi:CRP-like cAMP-binding protein
MSHFAKKVGQIIPGNEATMELVEPFVKEKHLAKNDFLLKAGTVCKKVILVCKGACYMYRDKDGKEEVVEFYFEGMFCSDYVSFIRQTPADNSIKTLEDSVVEEMSYDDLHYLYDNMLPIERAGRLITEGLFCGIVRRMLSYQNDSPEVRYQKLIEQRPMLFQRVPQYLIASLLGVTPVGLSKIRRRLHG